MKASNPKLGLSDQKSHPHLVKLFIFSFSAYLFGELIDRQKKKKTFMYSSGGGALQTRAGQKKISFFFGDLRPREHFFLFTKIFSVRSVSFLYAPHTHKPVSLSLSIVFAFFRRPISGSSYGRKRRLTSPFTLLDRCGVIDPEGGHHRVWLKLLAEPLGYSHDLSNYPRMLILRIICNPKPGKDESYLRRVTA